MYDLETTIRNNETTETRRLHIWDLGNNKFALGNRGEKAVWVVRRIANKKDKLGRGLPTYKGVQARKPVIGEDAKLIPREQAGRLLLAALIRH